MSLGKIFFLSGFSFTDTDDSQDSSGMERTIFYCTLPPPPVQEHLFATLHVKWLWHTFNRAACIYQAVAATRWDSPLSWITIWLVDDMISISVRLRDDVILEFWYCSLTRKTGGHELISTINYQTLHYKRTDYPSVIVTSRK